MQPAATVVGRGVRAHVTGANLLGGLLLAGVVLTMLLPALAPDGYRVGWLWWIQAPVTVLAFGSPALLLLRRDARSRVGWLLAGVAVLSCASGAASAWAWLTLVGRPGSLPGGNGALWVASFVWFSGYFLLPTVVLLLAPDGRMPGRRWRAVLWLDVVTVAVVTVVMATSRYPTGNGADVVIPHQPASVTNPVYIAWVQHWLGWAAALLPVAVVASLVALLVRRRRAYGVARRQLDVVVLGAVATVVAMVGAELAPRPWFLLVVAVAMVPYPAALAVAALRHRLWDLDLVVRRSVVYGALSVAIVVAYVAAIWSLGGVIGRTTGAPLLATTVVALAAAPMRGRLQRAVDARLYGDRSNPAAALRGVAERWRVEPPRDAVEVADRVARDVARALRLPYVRVSSAAGVVGVIGEPAEPVTRVALRHGGVVVGELAAGTREPGRPLSRRDEATLAEVAGYVAVVVHSLALTADLEQSRERLVVAREEERRRLRRDLHDGLGPQLAAIALQLETVRDLAGGAGTPAGDLVEDLRAQLRGVVGEVRQIVDGLRPPMLDDVGLAEALHQQASRLSASGVDLRVHVGELPPLTAAVELAVLRVVAEALTNVIRHSGARAATVTVDVAGGLLSVAVTDDGRGFGPVPAQGGVGLASMRERALELAGSCTVDTVPGRGTTVRAVLPVGVGAST